MACLMISCQCNFELFVFAVAVDFGRLQGIAYLVGFES